MKWSPPHIEHCRWPAGRFSLLLVALTGFSSGCSTLPVMPSPTAKLEEAAQSPADSPYTAQEKARMAGMPRVPVFDVPIEHAKTTVSKPVVSKPVVSKPVVSKPPVINPVASKPVASKPTVSKPTVSNSTASNSTASTPSAGTLHSPGTSLATAEPPKVATTNPAGVLVAPPKPFSWERTFDSTGHRPFLTATIGDDGYRTLVVGSIGGNDPIALELVDQLARHLHNDSLIMGGFESTIIRTLNPDGEANRTFLNQKDQYINHGFPKTGDKAAEDQPVEAVFLVERLRQLQPQRVLHIRTVQGENGLIAASSGCQSAAKEAAEWLKFKLVLLPEKAVAGSMERYISTQGNCDMITLAIPDHSSREELWSRYGDTLLNLLLGDDFATREVARKQAQQSSADRRKQSPGN